MITRRMAKAIMLSPNSGELTIGENTLTWVKRIACAWPLCQPHTKVDIYVNDELIEACDLSWIREYANG